MGPGLSTPISMGHNRPSHDAIIKACAGSTQPSNVRPATAHRASIGSSYSLYGDQKMSLARRMKLKGELRSLRRQLSSLENDLHVQLQATFTGEPYELDDVWLQQLMEVLTELVENLEPTDPSPCAELLHAFEPHIVRAANAVATKHREIDRLEGYIKVCAVQVVSTARTHTHTHTRTHARTHTHTRARAHTHTHMHTLAHTHATRTHTHGVTHRHRHKYTP